MSWRRVSGQPALCLGHKEWVQDQGDAGPVFGVLNPVGKGMKLQASGWGECSQEDGPEGQSPKWCLWQKLEGSEMQGMYDQGQVPVRPRATTRTTFCLKLIDEAGNQMFIHQTIAGDLLQ